MMAARPPGLLLSGGGRAVAAAAGPLSVSRPQSTTRVPATRAPPPPTAEAPPPKRRARKPTAAAAPSVDAAPRKRGSSKTTPTQPQQKFSESAEDAPESRKNPELYGAAASGTTGAYGSIGGSALPPAATATPSSPPPAATTTTTPLLRRKPEVLAPAGGWPQLKAAVENGADAVYFGLQSGLNARARASNFSPDELPQVTSFLHSRGAKGYLALNVLVFDEELEAFEKAVRLAASAGVDALIIQDVGAQEAARRIAPSLPIHGSTQMTITAAEGARFAASRGAKRVVVGRELSVREIAAVAAGALPSCDNQNDGDGDNTPAPASSPSPSSSPPSHHSPAYEVEAFVHGALCVAYSGQCWSSEAWGGRSANRGQCAQQCRMPYALYVDGQVKELAGGERFLLSPQDLAGVAQVPALVRAGVSCLKIEGRLKGPEYVALAARAYRDAVDAAWDALVAAGEVVPLESAAAAVAAGATTPTTPTPTKKRRSSSPSSASAAAAAISPSLPPAPDRLLAPVPGFSPESAAGAQALSDLRQLFSRGQDAEHDGLTPGFLEGPRHQRLVRGRAPRHRGLLLGKVRGVDLQRGRALVEGPLPAAGVKPGDGVVFDDGRADEDEPGGAVYGVRVVKGGGNRAGGGGGGGGTDSAAAAAAGARLVELQFAVGGASSNSNGASSSSSSPSSSAAAATRAMLRRVRPGDLVWKTRDHAAEQRARQSFEGLPAAATRRMRVSARAEGQLGEPMTVVYRAPNPLFSASSPSSSSLPPFFEGRAETSAPLERAGKRPLTAEDVAAALAQLGDTTFALGEDDNSVDVSGLALEQGLFMPASALKEARRAASAALAAAVVEGRRAARFAGVPEEPVVPRLLARLAADAAATSAESQAAEEGKRGMRLTPPRLRVLCRTREQAEAAIGDGPDADDEHDDQASCPWLDEVVLDFLEVHGLAEAVRAVQASGRRCVVALPRVLKPGERRLLQFYLRLGADALLLRGAGALQQLLELGGAGAPLPADVVDKLPPGRPRVIPALEGDFSLNVANALAADLLLGGSIAADGAGGEQEQERPKSKGKAATATKKKAQKQQQQAPRSLSRLAPTHDLDAAQLARLARSLGPQRAQSSLEAIVYSHVAIFHTEHCVFCRFLSDGNSYLDCGHPCEKHALHLRDGEGRDNAVLADQGCRNTVFSSQAQSGAWELERLTRARFGTLRLELVDEPPELVRPLLNRHRRALEGELSPGELWRWLGELPDRHGRVQGVTSGSLRVRDERAAASLRPTARRT